MVIRVISQFHDHEPSTCYIDPDFLREGNFIENRIKQELEDNPDAYAVHVFIYRNEVPEDAVGSLEGGLPLYTQVLPGEVEPGQIANKLIWLTITFE